MSAAHRNNDLRACGATTTVVGQDFVSVDGELWAVNGDPDSHGAGGLITSHPWLTINGLGIIVVGDSAAADNLCPADGGAHCAPSATTGDSVIQA